MRRVGRVTPELYLVTPVDADAAGFPALVARVLEVAPAAALLLSRGAGDEDAYGGLARALLPVTRRAGCALLVDDRPDLVRPLGADGVHMRSGGTALRAALADLKPDFIVGVGGVGSRHDAMARGELGVDYLLFGDRGSPEAAAEMAAWWAETFEIPCVYLASGPDDPGIGAAQSEFVALGNGVWSDPAGAATLLARGAA